MFKWLVDWYCTRLRALDVRILWPAIREQAPTIEDARAVFAYHVFNNFAWQRLSPDEIEKQIEVLS